MNYETYTRLVRERIASHGSQRYGQILYNVLWEVKEEVAREVQGTNIDPFYSDHRSVEERNLIQCRFLTYVKFRLDGEWIDLND